MPAFNQALGFTRYEADEYYKRALDAYRKGDFDTAIDSISDAIEALPGRSEYYATRGFFQLEDGAPTEALADFEQALKLYPYEMLAHYGRGMIAYKNRQWDEALQHFLNAYRADPKRGETLYYLALVYHQRGDQAAALQVMAQAQEALEAANDKRKGDAARWLRELQRLHARAAALLQSGKPNTGE